MDRIYKEHMVELNISPITAAMARTNVTFWSFDVETARKTITLRKNGAPLPLDDAEEITLVLQFAGRERTIHLNPEIVDLQQSVVSVVLPMQALGFDGEVTGGVFVRYHNGQSLDCGYFVFSLRTSSIDQDVGELSDFYVERFEALRQYVLAQVEEIEQLIPKIPQIEAHLEDNVAHITQAEREQWNAGGGGGGGGAVDSVNGQVGTVVLTASDVGAAQEEHTHGEIDLLKRMLFNDIDENQFFITFQSLDGLNARGIWNQQNRRLETTKGV